MKKCEKKDVCKTSFFSPTFLLNRKSRWKKRLLNWNLFFHPFLCQEQKIFQKIHKTRWKKRFAYRNLFFHLLLWQEWKIFSGLAWIWVKKKISFSKLFFHPLSCKGLNVKMGEKKVFYMQIFFFTHISAKS